MPNHAAAAAELPRNELIEKLNEALRKRADEMVNQALAPVLIQVAAPIAKALNPITGGRSAVALAAAELTLGDAISIIAHDAKEHVYQALMQRAIQHLSNGQDFFLT